MLGGGGAAGSHLNTHDRTYWELVYAWCGDRCNSDQEVAPPVGVPPALRLHTCVAVAAEQLQLLHLPRYTLLVLFWFSPLTHVPLLYRLSVCCCCQALGPQVVRTLLIPHLEPFMSAVLLPAMAATTQPDTPADAADADPRQHHSSSALRQQQQQQAAEAWRVYDALLSAVGGAVYDLLIGSMRGSLPVHLIFPRPASTQDTDWQAEYTRTLLAARRQAGPRREQQQGQLPRQPGSGGAGSSGMQEQQQQQGATKPSGQGDGAAVQAQQGQQGAADGRRALRGPPALIKGQGPRSAGSAAAAAGSNQPSVAEALGQSWKEDSDVNATLGALLSLFGEDLLPSLPLPELAAVSL